jgi:hypothetical protein
MANTKNYGKTEREMAPNAWLWVLIALLGIVLVAATIAGLWHFFRDRKGNGSSETPRMTSQVDRTARDKYFACILSTPPAA